MSFPCDVWKAAVGPDGAGPQWRERLTGLPALRTRTCRQLLVATPHLDEDICSGGGLIAVLAAQSVPVEVLAVTDANGAQAGGPDAAHPAELGYRRAHRGFAREPIGLWVLAPWHRDGHPDHDAVGRAAVVVCQAYRLRLVQYLTAAWRRGDPGDLPRKPLRQLPLSPLVPARKLRAIPAPLRGEGQISDREIFLTRTAGEKER